MNRPLVFLAPASTNVQTIYSGYSSFADLKTDRTMAAWGLNLGDPSAGGLTDVDMIYGTTTSMS